MPVPKPLNPEPYEIQRPTGCCAATGHKLDPGDPYIAMLVEPDPQSVDKPPASDKTDSPETTAAQEPARTSGNQRLPLFQRVDVSIDAWEQGHRPDRVFSYWRSVVPEPNRKKKLFVDDEVLIDLFERLADAEDTEKITFRFVLGLILMRKKRLKYDGHDLRPGPDGQDQEWWRMLLLPARGRGNKVSADPLVDTAHTHFELLDPKIDETQIQDVAEQLGQILDMEL